MLRVPPDMVGAVESHLNTLLDQDDVMAVIRRHKGKTNLRWQFTRCTPVGDLRFEAIYRPHYRDVVLTPPMPPVYRPPTLRIMLDKQYRPHRLVVRNDKYNVWGYMLGRLPMGWMLGATQVEAGGSSTQDQLYRLWLYQKAFKKMDAVPHRFMKKILDHVTRHHPIDEIKPLVRYNRRIIVADTVVDACPDLKGRKIPHDPEGKTYDHALGVYDFLTQKIVVARRVWNQFMNRLVCCYDVATTTSHEIGHARDDADNDLSQSRTFARAYFADLRRLSKKWKAVLADTIGVAVKDLKTGWARSEVLANLYADLRLCREGSYDFSWRKRLPRTTALVQERLITPQD